MICSRHLIAPIFSWHLILITWSILESANSSDSTQSAFWWRIYLYRLYLFAPWSLFESCLKDFLCRQSCDFKRQQLFLKFFTLNYACYTGLLFRVTTPDSSNMPRFADLCTSQRGLQAKSVRMWKQRIILHQLNTVKRTYDDTAQRKPSIN